MKSGDGQQISPERIIDGVYCPFIPLMMSQTNGTFMYVNGCLVPYEIFKTWPWMDTEEQFDEFAELRGYTKEASMKNNLHYYQAIVVSVYDGDTVRAHIDFGFGLWGHNQPLRLLRINTPEIRGGTAETKAAGIKARDRLRELVLGKEVIIRTFKSGKYGRYLAEIYLDGLNINDQMVEEGLAVYKVY